MKFSSSIEGKFGCNPWETPKKCREHIIKEKGLRRRENWLDGKEDVGDAIGTFEWRQDKNFPDF
ncbi:hypothetical protein GCM10007968_08830 [Sporolactobacillus putidus]|uniref:Uncharacterized protein n=1 Tax=Sporolactobacillus putidus TaxID=492735 RepID=A0A917VYY6_9BACL|nr:hypothetical protein GCM10007968_08830 [Sporolactobacillus putidus]